LGAGGIRGTVARNRFEAKKAMTIILGALNGGCQYHALYGAVYNSSTPKDTITFTSVKQYDAAVKVALRTQETLFVDRGTYY
jgi:hypothetical protein